MIRPISISEKSNVAIVGTSSTIAPFPIRTKRSLDALEGFFNKYVKSNSFNKDFHGSSGSIKERANDVNNCYKNKEIDLILTTTGGYDSNTILPLLDYDLIKDNPKAICGYSDTSALLLAIYKKTGLITFYGPALVPTFGEYGGPFSFSMDSFFECLNHNLGERILFPPKEITSEFQYWDRDDVCKRELVTADPWEYIHLGTGEGTLIVSNLETYSKLIGTSYLPTPKEQILCFEVTTTSLPLMKSYFSQVFQALGKETIKGIVFGRNKINDALSLEGLKKYLHEVGNELSIPILINVDFGHTDPRLTIPIGVKGKICSKENSFKILEPSVE